MNTYRIAELLRQLADEFDRDTPAETPSSSKAPAEVDELKALQLPDPKSSPAPESLDPPWDDGEAAVTLKDLQQLGAKLLAAGGRAILAGLLSEFGAKALSAAKPDDYAALARRIHDHLS